MDRATFIGSIIAATTALPLDARASAQLTTVAGVMIPDTTLAVEATEIARAVEPPEIFNHSLRTYLFGELVARYLKIDHDQEIVYVASILHDTGLSKTYMSADHPFEVDGANVARKLMSKHSVDQNRINLVWDAIALHDNSGIARQKQPEVMLVNAGVGTDFGAYLDNLASADIVQVLRAAPRTHFIDIFVEAAVGVAKRKPLTTAHSFVADLGYCKVPGFRLPSFCDGLQSDPFAAFEKDVTGGST